MQVEAMGFGDVTLMADDRQVLSAGHRFRRGVPF